MLSSNDVLKQWECMVKVLMKQSMKCKKNGPNHGKTQYDFLPFRLFLPHGHMISGHLWNGLSAFIQKYFWQNLKNSLVVKRNIYAKDLESPSGFIGCIWRLRDRVSAAPAILNMHPRQCVDEVTVGGKVKDMAAKITIVQNQFPCINWQIHWSYFGHDHGKCFAWWVAEKNCNTEY